MSEETPTGGSRADELERLDIALKKMELEAKTRDLASRRWVLTALVPVTTVLISVGSSILIARSASKARDTEFTADVIRAVVEGDRLEGFRKLELLLSAQLVDDPNGTIRNAVAALRPRVSAELAAQGREMMAMDSVPKALHLFRAAIEVMPDSAEYHYLLGHTLLVLGNARNHNPYREEARTELQKAYDAEPAKRASAYWLGRAHYSLRDFQRARTMFGQVTQDSANRELQAYTNAMRLLADIERTTSGRQQASIGSGR